jgi:rubrerythrin
MTKHTIGVYKAYKNSGNLRFHRKGTKKSWKHYFIEIDDYDEDEYTFGSEWVSSLRAVFLKKKQLYKKQFICEECGCVYTNYVKKNQDEDDHCPICDE